MSDIFKKIGDTITETGKTVGEKTKQVSRFQPVGMPRFPCGGGTTKIRLRTRAGTFCCAAPARSLA